MSILRIYHYPEAVLKVPAQKVAIFDDALRQLSQDMVETMYAAPGIGLAAPQIGISQRLIVIDCSAKDEAPHLIVAVNPEIVTCSGQRCEEEGCLSLPGYYADIQRSEQVTVTFQSIHGEVGEITAEGLLAVAFQHEIDHLDGILFVDHLSPLKRGIFRRKYRKIMEQQEEQL
jgi:peptide deformylase